METFGDWPGADDKNTYVVLEIVNVGHKKTELTHVVGILYTNWWTRLRKRSAKSIIVPRPQVAQPFPFVIGPGDRWLGGVEQNDELEKMSKSGMLYFGVHHSGGDRPLLRRLIIRKANVT
jgi:hypothetical protein